MNDLNVSQLEDLSVEVFFEIFEQLTPDELYSSMAHLNSRIDSILQKQPNLIISTKNHLKPALSFFDSFISLYIDLSNTSYTAGSGLSQFEFLNLSNVRSLRIRIVYYAWWTIVSIDELNSFINPNRSPLLESLHLSCCTKKLAEFIFTGAFQHLKVCIVKDYEEKVLPSTTTSSSLKTLRRFVTQGQNGNDFQTILSICSNLNFLRFQLSGEWLSFMFSNLRYPFMKRLCIGRPREFRFNDGQFDSLLALFPNLIDFSLSINHCRQHAEIIDFVKVADCLRHRLPRLKKLDWCIYLCRNYPYLMYVDQFPLIAQMHQLFRCIRKCQSLLYITSFNFNSKYSGYRYYVRPSSRSRPKETT